MTKTQAIAYFGSQLGVARALGITQPSVCNWGEHPPPYRQLQLELVTGGALVAEVDALPRIAAGTLNKLREIP